MKFVNSIHHLFFCVTSYILFLHYYSITFF
nr:MAG TPA: hypothetical protein [Caudoviricetes sp.]